MLAPLLRCDDLPAVWQPDEDSQRLRELSAHRAGLVAAQTRLKNRVRSLLAQRLAREKHGLYIKFAAIIEYGQDKDQTKALHPTYRKYLGRFLGNYQLRAAGPFAEDAGALWVLDADTAEAVEKIVKEAPSVAAGVIVGWKARPIGYWSAQEAKEAR